MAFLVMNPMGFLALLAATGAFIVNTILLVLQAAFAAIYWVLMNFFTLISNAFIAFGNFIVWILNEWALFGWAEKLGEKLGIDTSWLPDWKIPYLKYLSAPAMPETLETLMARLGGMVSMITNAWANYWSNITPGSMALGAGAGAAAGGITYYWRPSPEYLKYERRKHHHRPPDTRGRKVKKGKLPPGGSLERKKRIPPDRRVR